MAHNSKGNSKYNVYREQALELLRQNDYNAMQTAIHIKQSTGITENVEAIRHWVKKLVSDERENFDTIKHINTYPKLEIPQPKEDKPYNPIEDAASRRLKAALTDTQSRLKITQERLNETSDALNDALFLSEVSKVEIPSIIQDNPNVNEACAIVDWSDWHVEERVERGTTNGLNEYNPDIANLRVSKLASNTVKLIRKEQQNVRINKLLLILGGDFINNYLHEHDFNSNYMSPIQASAFAKMLLKRAILTVTQHANVKDVYILCIRGNHGRLTKKMQTNNDYRMNHEAMIYSLLSEELKQDGFNWFIPESGIGELEIFNKRIRAIHGHEFKFGGGIGGLSIPATKYFHRLDQTVKAHFNIVHHWHNYQMVGSNISVNGSLVGTNSYSFGLGMPHEEPKQTFQLLDAKRGFTVRAPIFCE